MWESTGYIKKMKVRFKKLVPEAVVPEKAHPSDAGFDLTCVSMHLDKQHNVISYGTGIAVEIPEGYVGLIFPRSSVYKKDLSLTNCVGVIDSGYRGEIAFKFRKLFPFAEAYQAGDRLGQMIIIPIPDIEFEEAETLEDSSRGAGGFGSTGN